MAILIVDDENNTREALRDLLSQTGGIPTILEARNGEEALKILDAERSRIRMIIADWEMPYMDGLTLVQRIAERPELDLAPFLLITSDMPRSKLAEHQQRIPRLDGCLIKPFRSKALSEALSQAYAHRQEARNTLIYCGPEIPTALAAALRGVRPPFWSAPVHARSASDLAQAAAAHGRTLGALVIDPAVGLGTWLATFSKTPAGAATITACASRDAEAIFPLRTLCQLFVEAGAGEERWSEALKAMRDRAVAGWDVARLFQETKAAQQRRDLDFALRHAREMAALDPRNAEVQAMLGDLSAEKGERKQAIAAFRASLDANPCLPRSYILLLDALSRSGERESALETARAAVSYCPQSPDVLFAAARAFRGAGDVAQARATLERLLARHPGHAQARELLGELPTG